MYPRERGLDQLVVVEAEEDEVNLLVEECTPAYVGRRVCAQMSEELSITHRLPDGGGSCTSKPLSSELSRRHLMIVSFEPFSS